MPHPGNQAQQAEGLKASSIPSFETKAERSPRLWDAGQPPRPTDEGLAPLPGLTWCNILSGRVHPSDRYCPSRI